MYLYEPGSYAPLTRIDQVEEEGQEVYSELLPEDRMQIIQVLMIRAVSGKPSGWVRKAT
jgi:hypothetical protein